MDNIESGTSKHDDPYATLTAHNGEKFSAWDEYYEFVERHQADIKDGWCKILYVEDGDYRNVVGIEEPGIDEIPDEEEVESTEDPLAGVPIGVQKRKMAVWKAAASTVDEQNHRNAKAVADETRNIADAMDEQCMDWIAEGGSQ